jgi:hypothetical protein
MLEQTQVSQQIPLLQHLVYPSKQEKSGLLTSIKVFYFLDQRELIAEDCVISDQLSTCCSCWLFIKFLSELYDPNQTNT